MHLALARALLTRRATNREVWFNGNLNIDINVYEDPDDYYGGSGGYGWGSGGAPGSDG